MNIHGCQPHHKVAIYVVKQLKNNSFRQGLYIITFATFFAETVHGYLGHIERAIRDNGGFGLGMKQEVSTSDFQAPYIFGQPEKFVVIVG